MKKFFKILGIVVLVLFAIAAFLFFNYLQPFMKKMKESKTIVVDKNMTIVTGGGGNSGIIQDDSLVIVIDTKMDEAANTLFETVNKLSGGKKVIVINTHWHPDHIGGNSLYKGATLIAGNYGIDNWNKETKNQVSPTLWLKDTMTINLKNDTLLVFSLNRIAHTTNDLMVYSKARKILFGGDVILNKQSPVLMGADAEGYLVVFDQLEKRFDITTIVPGHGQVKGKELINEFRQYFLVMKLAAMNSDKEDELKAKYKDWNQLPIFMSPSATVKHFKKHLKK